MKLWKHTLITAISFFGITATTLYTSCEKDSCLDLKCRNGGSCAEGYCRCPTGYEGSECEINAGTKFIGRFIGNVKCNQSAPLADTIDAWMLKAPDQIQFVDHSRITDTITGTAIGQDLQIPVYTSGNYRKTISLTVDNNRITYYIEEVPDVTNANIPKNVCYFIGYK